MYSTFCFFLFQKQCWNLFFKMKGKTFLKLLHILEHFEAWRGWVSFTKIVQLCRKKGKFDLGQNTNCIMSATMTSNGIDHFPFTVFYFFYYCLLLHLVTTKNQQYVKMIKYFSIITIVNAFMSKDIYGHFYRNDT